MTIALVLHTSKYNSRILVILRLSSSLFARISGSRGRFSAQSHPYPGDFETKPSYFDVWCLGHTQMIVGAASWAGCSSELARSPRRIKFTSFCMFLKITFSCICIDNTVNMDFVGIKGGYRHCFNMFTLSQACQQLKNHEPTRSVGFVIWISLFPRWRETREAQGFL